MKLVWSGFMAVVAVTLGFAQADLRSVPPDLRKPLIRRVNALVASEARANWDRQYELLSSKVRADTSKEAYTRNKNQEWAEASTYRLLGFTTETVQKFDKSIWGIDVWLVEGCGKFLQGRKIGSYRATTEAALENGKWRFSGLHLVSPVDGQPDKCGPRK